jgi:hypothetical protein
MSTEAWVAAGFGVIFIGLLFFMAVFLIISPRTVPPEAMWILRVILALAAAGFGVVLSGILKIDINIPKFAIQATSGFALFVIIYLMNPPRYVEAAAVSKEPAPGPVEKRKRPDQQARGNNK